MLLRNAEIVICVFAEEDFKGWREVKCFAPLSRECSKNTLHRFPVPAHWTYTNQTKSIWPFRGHTRSPPLPFSAGGSSVTHACHAQLLMSGARESKDRAGEMCSACQWYHCWFNKDSFLASPPALWGTAKQHYHKHHTTLWFLSPCGVSNGLGRL